MHTIERLQHRSKECILQRDSAVIWGKLASPSERVQRERHSACALNGHASFSQITGDVAQVERMHTIERLQHRSKECILQRDSAVIWGKLAYPSESAKRASLTLRIEWTCQLFPNNGRCSIGRKNAYYRDTVAQVERIHTIERLWRYLGKASISKGESAKRASLSLRIEWTCQLFPNNGRSSIARKNVYYRETVAQVQRMHTKERHQPLFGESQHILVRECKESGTQPAH